MNKKKEKREINDEKHTHRTTMKKIKTFSFDDESQDYF